MLSKLYQITNNQIGLKTNECINQYRITIPLLDKMIFHVNIYKTYKLIKCMFCKQNKKTEAKIEKFIFKINFHDKWQVLIELDHK